MTPQERDVLLPLLDKLRQARVTDKDAEADQLIAQALREQPDGAYILAQTVLMQDYALHTAQDRIHALEQQVQAGGQQQQSSGGFLSGLFGSGNRPAQPSGGPWGGQAPVSPYGPQIASAVQPQYQQPSFLHSAARTAAGIAGGALLFEGLESLFGGRGGFGGGGSMGGGLGGGMPMGGNTEVINNYYDQPVPDNSVGVQGGDSADDISDQGNFSDSDFGGGGDDGFNI